MSLWGVGPMVIGPAIALGVVIFALSVLYPQVGLLDAINPWLTLGIGALMAFLGFVQLFATGRVFMEGFRKGKLLTKGPFAKCQNPIYSVWILWIFPSLAIAFRMPYLFIVPLVAFVLMRLLIVKEQRALEAEFGQAYIKYCQRTPLIAWWVL